MTEKTKNIYTLIVLMVAVSVSLTVYMMPTQRVSEFSNYKEGLLANEKVTAPFDYEILRTDQELKNIREKVKETILPVFVLNDTLNTYLYTLYSSFISEYEELGNLRDAMKNADEKKKFLILKKDSLITLDSAGYIFSINKTESIYQALRKEFPQKRLLFNQKYGLNFTELSDPPLLSNRSLRKKIGYYMRRNISNKILDRPKSTIFNRRLGKLRLIEGNSTKIYFIDDFKDIEYKRERDLNYLTTYFADPANDSLKYWQNILNKFSRPSIIYDKNATNAMISKAQNEVPLAEGLVKKGDIIISKNEIITGDAVKRLRSLDMKLKEIASGNNDSIIAKFNFKSIAGRALISVLFYLILVLMLFFNRKKYFNSTKALIQLFLILVIHLLLVHISSVIVEYFNFDYTPYLVMMSVTSVLAAVFFDMRVAFTITIVAAVLTGLITGNNFVFFFIPLFSGLLTMYGVNRVRDIFQFIYKILLFTFIGLIIPAIGFYLIFNTGNEQILTVFLHCAINAAASPLIALTVLTIMERIFKTPTDVSLLQLSDMSRPLLKKLQVEAPGTYHHSITVGNLAEAAAEAINANSLLARVGAYYHDIGKTFKAAYFIENQKNMPNKHDKMAPNMSAFILSAHVKEGIKLAYEYKLPEIIINFIRTHHGTSIMEFFYEKALKHAEKTGEKVNESIFRYPGPKPNTKETAIVMLSDIVEAKCRTESNSNIDKYRQIINDIILNRFKSGELDECDIKLNDLSKIREAMIPVITGMYHSRIEYPEQNNDKSNTRNSTNSKDQ